MKKVLVILLVCKPFRFPVANDANSKTDWINLLTHAEIIPPSFSATTTVMWLVRFKMLYARPCARGWNRFSVGPGFDIDLLYVERSTSML